MKWIARLYLSLLVTLFLWSTWPVSIMVLGVILVGVLTLLAVWTAFPVLRDVVGDGED